MATLWALTGTLDPRPMQDAKVADVVNDDSKVSVVDLVKFHVAISLTSDGALFLLLHCSLLEYRFAAL